MKLINETIREELNKLKAGKISSRAIAKKCGIPEATMWRALNNLRVWPSLRTIDALERRGLIDLSRRILDE